MIHKTKINISKEDYDKWLVGLRDGSYPQGTGALAHLVPSAKEDEVHYCCLGVLGDIVGERVRNEYDTITFKFGEQECGGYLPDTFIPWKVQTQLANMNDGGSTFIEIANYIEQNLEPMEADDE